MTYINFSSENDKYWIELDSNGLAIRQIMLSDGCYHISALEDCLAEGIIVPEDLDADVIYLSGDEFEQVWENSLKKYRKEWDFTKQKYKIGSLITAELVFYYPQGPIFKIDNSLIKYVGNREVQLHEKTRMTIVGYDDTDMWIIAQ